MKNIVLSADGDRVVYSVPDVVADRLEDYCMEFCCHWLPDSPCPSPTEAVRSSISRPCQPDCFAPLAAGERSLLCAIE